MSILSIYKKINLSHFILRTHILIIVIFLKNIYFLFYTTNAYLNFFSIAYIHKLFVVVNITSFVLLLSFWKALAIRSSYPGVLHLELPYFRSIVFVQMSKEYTVLKLGGLNYGCGSHVYQTPSHERAPD